MLQAPPSKSPHTRGHAHKRSAAISGDFDLDFFRGTTSISQAFEKQELYVPVTPTTHQQGIFATPTSQMSSVTPITAATVQTPMAAEVPSVVVTEAESSPRLTFSPYKGHTRLNSWAHSGPAAVRAKCKSPYSSQVEYSSSTETSPETKNATLNYAYGGMMSPKYDIPEAIIDLDLASGVYFDPATQKHNTKIQHRRTESAPELENFFKPSMNFGSGSASSRKNSAIFEEEDEDDDDDVSSAASSNHMNNNNNGLNGKNMSSNSLNSNSSTGASRFSPVFSTPQSSKSRRGGATAARYQNYYNNSLLLSSHLSAKSSENLNSKKTAQQSTPHNLVSTSSSSSTLNSPPRFKFESRVYDMPPATSSPETKSKQTHSPKRSLTNNSVKSHKKSKSLLSSISQKFRTGGGYSSQENLVLDGNCGTDSTVVLSDADEGADFDAHNVTLTPLNFGEPGPALDLTTMTPKYNYELDDTTNKDINLFKTDKPVASKTSHQESTKKSEKKHKRGFFHWMKK